VLRSQRGPEACRGEKLRVRTYGGQGLKAVFFQRGRVQDAMLLLKANDLVLLEVRREVLVVQHEGGPLWSQVGCKVFQCVAERGARLV